MESYEHPNTTRNKIDELCMVVGENVLGKNVLRDSSVEEFYRSIQSWLVKKEAEIEAYKKRS